ncbi:MAG: J domain-containing protein [Bacteroidota bacterium]
MQNYYHVLGVTSDATVSQLKQAYFKKSKQYHPDKNGDANWAKERFQLINEAYNTLSDPWKRLQHDKAVKAQQQTTHTVATTTHARVHQASSRITPTKTANQTIGWFQIVFTICLALVFFTVAVYIFEDAAGTVKPIKEDVHINNVSYSTQAYESERARFMQFCTTHPNILSTAEFNLLIQQPLEPGFTYVLNRLLVQGDTSDIHYLIERKYSR